MNDKEKDSDLKIKLSSVLPHLNEKQRRILIAAEACNLGYGGIEKLSKITGVSRPTIYRGIKDLNETQGKETDTVRRVRKKGGGRKKIIDKFPGIVEEIENLMEPSVRGDPESPLRWTCKSVRVLEKELRAKGYQISYPSVASLLKELEFSLQANQKTLEGAKHPDRNKQFEFINKRAKWFLERDFPVVSIDTKKKELIGNYKNGGKKWSKKRNPEQVNVHDFAKTESAKAVPYGVYDVGKNEAWVNVGISADTAEFSVESIRQWWKKMGKKRYPKTSKLLLCADSGGSNSYCSHLWKWELYQFAKQERLAITVCHYPPGTSKWNKIEHRLFSYISINWRGQPLRNYQTVVNLIAATTTKAGLRVQSRIDKKKYKTGIKVPKEKMKQIRMKKESFHGEWNYTILNR